MAPKVIPLKSSQQLGYEDYLKQTEKMYLSMIEGFEYMMLEEFESTKWQQARLELLKELIEVLYAIIRRDHMNSGRSPYLL